MAFAPLDAIRRRFERFEGGTLVLLYGAVPTRLGEVVRFFSPAPPWDPAGGVMQVCMGASDLADVPVGCRMLLRIRAEEVPYLNVIRPYFAERKLRTVLWADEEALGPLLQRAVDLVSWVFRRVEVPQRRWPAFAEQGVRAAIDVGIPFAWDGERDELEALLVDVGWSSGTVELRASMSFREMLRRLEGTSGLVVVEGIERDLDPWRVRMALARSGRGGAWVALRPSVVLPGSWRLHARQADWEQAAACLGSAGWEHAGAMAAWVDLEPERIEEAVDRVGMAPVDSGEWDAVRVAVGDGPVWVLRARIGDEEVAAARALLRNGGQPEDPAAQVVWAEGAEAWRDDAEGAIEARLVRCLRWLGEQTPHEGCVNAAAALGLTDVAAELGRLRFERGATDDAGRIVDWLEQYGEVEEALRIAEQWAERARSSDDERSLGLAWNWLGDLHKALGNGEQARRCYEDGLTIAQTLVKREPGRSDLQRELSVSYDRLGDLHSALGNGKEARRYYEDGLAIVRTLVEREPGRSDLQRELSLSYDRLGDLHRALGNGQEARHYYEDGLTIRRTLVEREPGRSDLQRDLSASYDRLGDLHVALGNGEEARRYYEDGLAIRRTLVEREPGRSDLQRGLPVSYDRLGDLHVALGNGEEARRYYEDGLAIRRTLVEREPGRSDLQRDLSVSFNHLGDLHRTLGNGEEARRYYEDGLAIRRTLVEREPGRSDLQRDLSVSFNHLGDLHRALGNGDEARRYYEDGVAIAQTLVEREPGRSDFQGDLARSYERMAVSDPDRAVEWLRKAIELHRARRVSDPTNAVIVRELGVVLAHLGRASLMQKDSRQAVASFAESLTILQDLRDRGALDARYIPLLEQLTED